MSRPLDTVPLHNADLSFDDLQYSGVVASRRLHCRECNSIQNMSERENRYYCLTCAAPYQQSENNNSNNNNSNGGDENVSYLLHLVSILPFNIYLPNFLFLSLIFLCLFVCVCICLCVC